MIVQTINIYVRWTTKIKLTNDKFWNTPCNFSKFLCLMLGEKTYFLTFSLLRTIPTCFYPQRFWLEKVPLEFWNPKKKKNKKVLEGTHQNTSTFRRTTCCKSTLISTRLRRRVFVCQLRIVPVPFAFSWQIILTVDCYIGRSSSTWDRTKRLEMPYISPSSVLWVCFHRWRLHFTDPIAQVF